MIEAMVKKQKLQYYVEHMTFYGQPRTKLLPTELRFKHERF